MVLDDEAVQIEYGDKAFGMSLSFTLNRSADALMSIGGAAIVSNYNTNTVAFAAAGLREGTSRTDVLASTLISTGEEDLDASTLEIAVGEDTQRIREDVSDTIGFPVGVARRGCDFPLIFAGVVNDDEVKVLKAKSADDFALVTGGSSAWAGVDTTKGTTFERAAVVTQTTDGTVRFDALTA